jgi:hypothetical protein
MGEVTGGSQTLTELQERVSSATAPSAPATVAPGEGAVGGPPDVAEASGKAAQHTIGELFQESGAEEAVKEVTSGKAGPSRIEDTASRFANSDRTIAQAAQDSGVNGIDRAASGSVDPSSEVGQTLSRAVGSKLPGAGERYQQAAQGVLSALLQDKSVEGAVAEATTGTAAEAITKADPPSPALDHAVAQAVNSLEGQKGITVAVADTRFSSLVDETTSGVKDLVNLAGTDSAKQGMAATKSATWQDLTDAVSGARKDDLESSIVNSERDLRTLVKKHFLEPVGGADVEGEPSGRGVGGHSVMLISIILTSFLFICFVARYNVRRNVHDW